MTTLARSATLAAGLGGLFWTVKALVITANDGSFGSLEDFLFIGGLLALVAAAVLYALLLSRRYAGIARVAVAAAGVVGLIGATLLVETIGKAVLAALASGDNVGLEQEGGILVAGLAWLIVAATAGRRRTGVTISRRPRRVPG